MSGMLRSAPANVPALAQPLFSDTHKRPCTSWLSRSAGAGGGLEAVLLLPPCEPTSVLDIRSPSPSSTLSSSFAASSSDGGLGSVDESSGGAVAVSAPFCDGASDGQSLSDDGSAPRLDADDLRLHDHEISAAAAATSGWHSHPRAGIGQYSNALKLASTNITSKGASADPLALIPSPPVKQQQAPSLPPPVFGAGPRCFNQLVPPPNKIVKDESKVADGSLEDCVMAYRRKRDREDYLAELMGACDGDAGRPDNVSSKSAPEWFHSDWNEIPPASAPAAPVMVPAEEKGAEFDSRAQLDLYEAMQVLYRSGGGSPSSATIPQPVAATSAILAANSAPEQQRLPISSAPPFRRLHLGSLLDRPVQPSAAAVVNAAAAYAVPAPQFQDLPIPAISSSLAGYKFRPAPHNFSSVSNSPNYVGAGEARAVEQRLSSSPPVLFGRHSPAQPAGQAGAAAGENTIKRGPLAPAAADRVGRCVQVEELWSAERQLSHAVEVAAHGDIVTAQAILARLNQRSSSQKGLRQQKLSSSQRAIFHFKEALARRMAPPPPPAAPSAAGTFRASLMSRNYASAVDIIAKISAYKSFCVASPIPQFAHFMANQAILDATEGELSVRVIDFELGLGGQWASLMQEMAQRNVGGAVTELKITTVVGEETLETSLARENLLQFGKEVGLRVEVEAMGVAKMEAEMGKWGAGTEAVVVNFGVGLSRVAAHFVSGEALLGFLQWLRALSPKVVAVSECEPPPFLSAEAATGVVVPSSYLYDALQFYACVLESLDAAVASGKLSSAELAEIEAQIVAPRIEEAAPPPAVWGALLQKAGFVSRRWSAAAEGQAAYLASAAAAGFSVRKHQEALQLAWYNKALVSATAWA